MMDNFGLNKFVQIITHLPEDVFIKQQESEQTLEKMIVEILKISLKVEFECDTLINLLTLIRKVMPNDKIITNRQYIIDETLEMAKERVMQFDVMLHNHNMPHNEETLLNAFAETLLFCTPYINNKIPEDSLYVLLSSGFSSLQRAAFFTLNHLYANFIPQVLHLRDVEEEIKEMQVVAVRQANMPEQEQVIDLDEKDIKKTELAQDKPEF